MTRSVGLYTPDSDIPPPPDGSGVVPVSSGVTDSTPPPPDGSGIADNAQPGAGAETGEGTAPATRLPPELEAQWHTLVTGKATPDELVQFAAQHGFSIDPERAKAVVQARDSGQPYDPNPIYELPQVQTDAVGAFGRGAANGIFLGGLPTLDAGIQGAKAALSGGDFGDTYNRQLDYDNAVYQSDEQNHLPSSLAGNLAGGALLPVGLEKAGITASVRAYGTAARDAALAEGATVEAANRIAARAITHRIAAEGAGYGGAYGFNSSSGGVSDRLVGGLEGAGTGVATGLLLRPLAGKVPAAADANDGQAVYQAGQRQGIDVLPADVGGPTTRRLTSAAAQAPISAAPIINASQKMVGQARAARDRLASSIGQALDPEAAGLNIRQGAQNYISTSGTDVRNAYHAAEKAAGGVKVAPTKALEALDRNIAELSETPGGAPSLEYMKSLRKALTGQELPASVKQLPELDTLNTPPAPSLEQMQNLSRVENVPLSQARAGNGTDWAKFDAGQHPGDMLEGYGAIPVAGKREDGTYFVFDGNHRATKALNSGQASMPMHVINVKDYAPDAAGLKPRNQINGNDDDLLRELGAHFQPSDAPTKAVDSTVTPAGLLRMRTVLRDQFMRDGLVGSDTERRVGQVLDAAGQDVTEGLQAADKPQAASLYAAAAAKYKTRIDTINNVLKPIIGTRDAPRSGEAVTRTLMADLQSNNARAARLLKTLPPEAQQDTAASIIGALGNSTPGAQNADGNAFSMSQFLTQWNKIGPSAKRAFFNDETRSALNDLAKVADASKQAQGYANKSNTSGGIWGNLGVLAGGAAASPAAAVTGGVAQLVGGHLLASPKFARWLARAPRTALSDTAYIDRLDRIAKAEPAIASDVIKLKDYLTQDAAQ